MYVTLTKLFEAFFLQKDASWSSLINHLIEVLYFLSDALLLISAGLLSIPRQGIQRWVSSPSVVFIFSYSFAFDGQDMLHSVLTRHQGPVVQN